MANYDVDPKNELDKAVNLAFKKVGDLTIPLIEMGRSWFKSNKSIFPASRVGPGKYVDLTPKYKKQKTKAIGSAYPILQGFVKSGDSFIKSGKLAKSMTDPSNPDAISLIVNKKTLVLGTKVTSKKGHSYPASLNFGTNKMVARPFMLLGGEQVATSAVNARRKAWIASLADYVKQVSEGFAK